MKFQVADVTRALGSVKKICMAGNRVVFDEESYIENKELDREQELKNREEGM